MLPACLAVPQDPFPVIPAAPQDPRHLPLRPGLPVPPFEPFRTYGTSNAGAGLTPLRQFKDPPHFLGFVRIYDQPVSVPPVAVGGVPAGRGFPRRRKLSPLRE